MQKNTQTVTIDEELSNIAERKTARYAIFDNCRLNLTNFKFNRDEVNDYG